METNELLLAIARRINWDNAARDHILQCGGYRDKEKTIDALTWENAAGNHAFDDCPETYGITKSMGQQLRAAFQQTPKDCIKYLIEIKAVKG